MSAPPPETIVVLEWMLRYAWDHRFEGITFGGRGLAHTSGLETVSSTDLDKKLPHGQQPSDLTNVKALGDRIEFHLQTFADSTWSIFNVIGIIIFYNGGAVFHGVNRMTLTVDSSHESECIATAKAAERTAWARDILHGFGQPQSQPTPIKSDNAANVLVANGQGSAKNSKHFLRRYCSIKQRVQQHEITVGHVPDSKNPADFLTKWVSKQKLNASVQTATNNTVSAVKPPRPTEASAATARPRACECSLLTRGERRVRVCWHCERARASA